MREISQARPSPSGRLSITLKPREERTLSASQVINRLRPEIAKVEGVDGVFIGPADLSIALGVAGDFLHAKMVDAMEKIRDSCVAHGVTPGTQTRSLALAKFWRERGMRFLGCSSEIGMLFERASELSKELA